MYYNDVYNTLTLHVFVVMFITDGAGFVWDPSADAWEERFQELRTYTYHVYIYIYIYIYTIDLQLCIHDCILVINDTSIRVNINH